MEESGRNRVSEFSFSLFIFLASVVVVNGSSAFAASILNFPRLSFEQNTLTGIAIVNPSNQNATVTFIAYGADGSQINISGFRNPAQLTVPANQQIAKLASEVFGGTLPPSLVSWFQATSSVDGLTGFFLYLDGADTLFDGADLPPSASKIVFNQVRADSGYTTELNILNPGDNSVNVGLQLVGTRTSPVNKSVTVPAKGIFRFDAGNFFGITATSDGAYVAATSDGSIAGFEFVRTPSADLLGLNARNANEQLSNLFFPQMAVLGPWKTELGLVNYSSSPVIVTVSAFKPDGTAYGPPELQNNPVARSLGAGGSLRGDAASMFGFSESSPLDGWIKVESTSSSINGYVSYGTGNSVAAVAGAPAGLTRAIFSHIATSAGFFNGVAVLNPGTLAANVRILAIQPSGAVLGSYDAVLQPGQRVSKLIDELIPKAAGQGGGVIWIKSDQPVYLTELFGTRNTLANVPAQPAPESYRPDLALPSLRLVPSLAPLQVGSSQTFQVQNATGALTWKVNGVIAGNANLGTISAEGIYKAPTAVPVPQLLTVTAETAGQVAGASIDILKKEALVTGLGVVQSVTYLRSLQKLYAAELTVVSTSQPSAQTMSSGIFEVSPGNPKVPVVTYGNELIAKMIPFASSDGKEFLLLVGQSGGRIIRLNPATKESKDVLTGLNQPIALVIDPASGNLLVAEADKITLVPRSLLETPSGAKEKDGRGYIVFRRLTNSGSPSPQAVTLFSASEAGGIAVDPCTGNIYFSDSKNGLIRVYLRLTGEIKTVASGLNNPGQLLAVSRNGVSCPFSLQILVVERGLDRVSLILPAESSIASWVSAPGGTDIAFLPSGTPFISGEGVLLAEAAGQLSSQISVVKVPDLYKAEPAPLPTRDPCLGITFADANLEAAVRRALGISGGTPITCDLTKTLIFLDAEFKRISNLSGLEPFSNFQKLILTENSVSDIRPLSGLSALTYLLLNLNRITDLSPLSGLKSLRTLDLSSQFDRLISDIAPIAQLTGLARLRLGGNSIKDISPLSNLNSLEELNLSSNDISNIVVLSRLHSLTNLDLHNNSITDIASLAGLTALTRLDLTNNSLSDIGPLSGLTALRELELINCSISDVRPLVANPGLAAGASINLIINNLTEKNCPDLKILFDRGVKLSVNPQFGGSRGLVVGVVNQNPFTEITSIGPTSMNRGVQRFRAIIVGKGDLPSFARSLPTVLDSSPLCDISVFFSDENITASPYVLTSRQRQGDFSGESLPPILDPLTQQPFPGNIIPANRLSTVMVLPIGLTVGNNVKPGTYTFKVIGPKGDVISSGSVTLSVQ